MKIRELLFFAACFLCTACANSAHESMDQAGNDVDEICRESYDIALDSGFSKGEINDRKDSDHNTAINYRLCRPMEWIDGEVCINAVTEKFCGECDNKCPDNARCVNTKTIDHKRIYECQCSQKGEEICGDACIDTQTNPLHCGSCDHQCPHDPFGKYYSCVAGECKCPDGYELVGNECIDYQTDVNHCGDYNTRCLFDTKCDKGACTRCPDGFVLIKGGQKMTVGSASISGKSEFHDAAYTYNKAADSDNVPDYFAEVANNAKDSAELSEKLYQILEQKRSLTISHDFCIMSQELMENTELWLANKYDASHEKPLTRTTWREAVSLANEYTNFLNRHSDQAHQLEFCYTPHNEAGKCDKNCEMDDRFITDYSLCNGVRLPSEYEWEYAARAPKNGAYTYRTVPTAGSALMDSEALQKALSSYAWYDKTSQNIFHTPSEKRDNNGAGIYNMQGNVAEWTNDAFDEKTAKAVAQSIEKSGSTLSPLKDPVFYQKSEGDSPVLHVVRGCHINSPAVKCRDAQRSFESNRSPVIGQRFVIAPIYDADKNLLVSADPDAETDTDPEASDSGQTPDEEKGSGDQK